MTLDGLPDFDEQQHSTPPRSGSGGLSRGRIAVISSLVPLGLFALLESGTFAVDRQLSRQLAGPALLSFSALLWIGTFWIVVDRGHSALKGVALGLIAPLGTLFAARLNPIAIPVPARDSPKSRSPDSRSQSWSAFDLFVTGVWLAIPVVAFVGRHWMLPIVDGFGLDVPVTTRHLLQIYSPVLLTISSLAVLVTLVAVPHGDARRLVVRTACVIGIIIVVGCLLSFLIPLNQLLNDLS